MRILYGHGRSWWCERTSKLLASSHRPAIARFIDYLCVRDIRLQRVPFFLLLIHRRWAHSSNSFAAGCEAVNVYAFRFFWCFVTEIKSASSSFSILLRMSKIQFRWQHSRRNIVFFFLFLFIYIHRLATVSANYQLAVDVAVAAAAAVAAVVVARRIHTWFIRMKLTAAGMCVVRVRIVVSPLLPPSSSLQSTETK